MRALLAMLGISILSGCAYVRPYVDRDVTPVEPVAGDLMPNTERALSKIGKWEDSVDEKHRWAVGSRRTLNLVTFGLGTGVAARAAMQSTGAGIRNLSLGAGAIYAGSSLFLPNEQVALYNSATKALMCIQGRARALREDVIVQNKLLPTDTPDSVVEASDYKSVDCIDDTVTGKAYNESKQAYGQAVAVVVQARESDGIIAAKIEDAAQNVILTLNEQLDQLAPSQDAILDAAKSAATIAASTRPTVQAQARGAFKANAGCTAPSKAVTDQVRAQLAQKSTSYAAIEAAIKQQINAIGSLDTACTSAPAQVAPLTLDNSAVSLTKDSQFVVDIQGGLAPYRTSPSGSAYPSELLVQVIGSKLVVTAKASIQSGTYTVEVMDRAAVPNTAKLSITVK